jgi:hypothetical protein
MATVHLETPERCWRTNEACAAQWWHGCELPPAGPGHNSTCLQLAEYIRHLAVQPVNDLLQGLQGDVLLAHF